MSAQSGQYGQILADGSLLVECTKWSLSRSVADKSYATCATGGYRKRKAGTKDATGTLEGVFDPSDPIENYVQEGDEVVLKLYYAGSKYHQVPALIISIDEEVDIEEGELIRWTIQYGLNGTYALNQSDS